MARARRAITTWAPAIDGLTREGFFRLPHRRAREEAKEALLARFVLPK